MKTLAVLLAATVTCMAAAQDQAGVEEAFAAVARYDWGESRAPLRRVELMITAVTDNPVQSRMLEAQLIAVLESRLTTRAARDFACRQLVLIGSDRCVSTLVVLLDDDELAAPALAALEAIPHPEAHRALIAAAERQDGPRRLAIEQSLQRRSARLERLIVHGNESDVPGLLAMAAAGSGTAWDVLERMRGYGVDASLAAATGDGDTALAVIATRLLGTRGASGYRQRLDELARPGEEPARRCAALLAIVELSDWRDPAPAGRTALLLQALDLAPAPADQLAVLELIAGENDPLLLAPVLPMTRSEETAVEAALVATHLALQLPAGLRDKAIRTLEDLARRFADDPMVRAEVVEAISRVEASEGYLAFGELAGPYPKSEAAGTLIDHAFAPEESESAGLWRPVPAAAIREPGIVDFNRIFRGNDRCAYARVVVRSDREQDARLEIGSDDGIKVWLNGEVVHRNDAMRGLTLRQDTAPVCLAAGRNVITVKVTQGGGDWQFAVRLRGPDGLRITGVEAARDR